MPAILKVEGLKAFYGATQALFGIDLEVETGGVTALLGANGAGKSTTLRAICRMIRTEGSILLAGEPVSHLPTESIVRRGLAHVPDGRGTFAELTVDENLRLGGYLHKTRKDLKRNVDLVLNYFPALRPRLKQQAGMLSGGEQQMLAISRALMLNPRLMVLDEPSFGLAPLIVQEIFRIMRQINAEEGVSLLLVEQNAKLALDLADKAYLLETGHMVIAGPASELRQNDDVRRAYLGA